MGSLLNFVIKFKNGKVEDIIINKNPKPIESIEW